MTSSRESLAALLVNGPQRHIAHRLLPLITILLIVTAPLRAQADRVALVIGNGAYRAVPTLSNPPNDARGVAATLNRLGFRTELLLDADQAQMQLALRRLAKAADGAEAALLFYAGHAAVLDGRNMLVPVSAAAGAAEELASQSIRLNSVMNLLAGRASTTMIILDACRDSPFTHSAPATPVPVAPAAKPAPSPSPHPPSRGIGSPRGGGLAGVSTSAGMLIAFASAPGRVALDGKGEHSPFTAALLRHLEEPGVEVRQMLGEVRRDVHEATAGRQIPWDNSSLESSFFLRAVASVGPSALTLHAAEALRIGLPPDIQTRAFVRTGPGAALVGTWSSGKVGWGGRGRAFMLIVLGVDAAAGTANVVVAAGPPTEHSWNPEKGATFRSVNASYRDGRIERSFNGGWRQIFLPLSDTELQGTEITSPDFTPPNHEAHIRLRRVE